MKVLQKLREFHMYLKLKKFEFHCETVHFLGYVINQHSIHMDQRKVQAVIHINQGTTMLLGVCKLLQEVHQQLPVVHQQDLLTFNLLDETWGQVSLLEL